MFIWTLTPFDLIIVIIKEIWWEIVAHCKWHLWINLLPWRIWKGHLILFYSLVCARITSLLDSDLNSTYATTLGASGLCLLFWIITFPGIVFSLNQFRWKKTCAIQLDLHTRSPYPADALCYACILVCAWLFSSFVDMLMTKLDFPAEYELHKLKMPSYLPPTLHILRINLIWSNRYLFYLLIWNASFAD